MNDLSRNRSNDKVQLLIEILIFFSIIAVGFASRFWLVDMPNFKPVAALVLFGAFFFRRSYIAIVALMLVMAMSDLKLGFYEWQLAAAVYAGLAVAGLLGVWVKRSLDQQGGIPRLGAAQLGRFAIASLVMSTAFFVLTNGAVWMIGGWYPSTWTGLVECYVAGIPFYRATLLGDLCFTGILVSGYLAVQWAVSMRFSNFEKFATAAE